MSRRARTLLATATAAATALLVGTAPAADRPGALVVGEIPDHWRALPELASPGRRALEGLGADVETTAGAWGDPAAGVYALLLTGHANAIPRPRNRISIATDVHDRLRGVLEGREATLASWVTTTGARAVESRASVEQFGQRGELVAWSGYDDGGRLVGAAALCFRNDRVPERTERECRAWLDSLRPTVTLAPLDPDADPEAEPERPVDRNDAPPHAGEETP